MNEMLQKTENVANKNSQDLTAQWKKGKLPECFYFVNDGAEVTIDYYLCDYWERHFDSDVQQVLAPVPTFDELQNMNKAVNECMAANIKLVEQNAQLKELLKECFEYIDWTDGTGSPISQQELLDKINEALR